MRTGVDLSDVMLVLGVILLGAGLAAYDWRLALVVLGVLLLIGGFVTAWRAA